MDAWFFAYVSVVSWQYHPGSSRDGYKRLTLEEAADVADAIVLVALKRGHLTEEELCQSSGQPR